MSVEAIAAIGATAAVDAAPATVQPQPVPGGNFGNWFTQELAAVNDKLVQADNDITALASGNVQSLHEVMMRMEEAKLSFQLLAQVRNRLLEAYQEVMRTQV
jgi:flagellar hook-basal body complex protein FliE